MRKREPSLHDLVRDTPVASEDPNRERLARYMQDLDSLAPPSNTADRIGELKESGKLTRSGSWVVEDVLEKAKAEFQRQAVEKMILEHDRDKELQALRAERDEAQRAIDDAVRSRRDRKNGIVIGIVVGAPALVVALIELWLRK